MVIRAETNAKALEYIYDICNRLFKGKECFYTDEELAQKRKNENNKFLTRRNHNERN